MLRFRMRDGPSGEIDKIGIRDGDFTVHEFANLVIGRNNTWETLKLELLPGPRSYSFGLGVSIHVIGSLPIEAPLSHIPTSI